MEAHMSGYRVVGWAVVAVLVSSGCMVKESTYKASVAEAQAAKEELERTRAQKNALEQQVKTLKDLNVKFGNEAQAAHDELARIEHSRDKERGVGEVRMKELEDKVKQLSAQNRSMKQEYEDVKRHNETLRSLVARYQKELKERPRAATVTPSSPFADVPPTPAAPSAPAAPAVPPPPAQTAAAPMNLNKASANDMVLFLGLSKDVADRIVSNRPYRLKGELVAKNLVPKETFDLIKDRVTVSP
jgi:DNA uptake protein ComE-like DNA-binding protein